MRYASLFAKMKIKKITIEDISKFLGCHRNSIYNKIYGNGNSDFTLSEAFLIRDNYFSDESMESVFEKNKLPHELVS